MKIKNKHGRIGVKTPLSTSEKRSAFRRGYDAGATTYKEWFLNKVAATKSLRDLKKELDIS